MKRIKKPLGLKFDYDQQKVYSVRKSLVQMKPNGASYDG